MKNLLFLVLLFNGLSCFSQQGTYIWTLKSTTCGTNGTTYESLLTKISFKPDQQFSQEFNLIDKINAYYRFANMDINTIALKLQADFS
jgi:hypothetical protein